MSRQLEIWLHNRLVGRLSEAPEGGTEFRFLDTYLDAVPRPILGQKFEDNLGKTYRSRKGQGLPDFFANLIPEGRLREVIEESAGIDPGDDLALLAFVGRDLPGAVVVRPADNGEPESSSEEPFPSPAAPDEAAESSEGLRFSLAGVQLKFSVLLEENKLTLPAKDQGGEWIAKFDSPAFPRLPENELSMLTWAREAGFDVPECRLHDVEDVVGFPRRFAPSDTKVLAIQRYDRGSGERVHQEDFAQAVGLPPKKKYDHVTHEAMARLVRGFIDESAVDELIRRLVFVVACGNNDGHLKNWSFVYPGGIQAAWSPLYDQVATVAWTAPDRKLALNLAGVKDFGRIDRSAFERFAERAEVAKGRLFEQVDETLDRLRVTWRRIEADLPLPESHLRALREHWQRVPLLRDAGTLE